MKKLLPLLLIMTLNCFAQAPTIQWQKSFGGSREETALDVLQTPDGGYIFVGRANSVDGDVVGYQWNYDLFNGDVWVVKTDAVGTIEWQKLYGGYANDGSSKIIATSDGGYVLACASESSNGTVTNPIGGYDYWILKLSSIGDLQWQKRLGGTSEDMIRDIKQTSDDGYIVTGRSSSNLPNAQGLREVYTVKLTSAGTVQWWKPYGGSADDVANSICQTPDGGYIMVGSTKSSNGSFTSNHGMSDAFLIKTNAVGIIEWQKTYGGSNDDFGHTVIVLADGSYVFSASSMSSNGDLTTNNGNTDLWVVKTDNSGNIIWQKSYGGSVSECYDDSEISQTSDGGFVIGGIAYSNNGDASGNHSYNTGDAWAIKLDRLGNKLWHRCFGGTAEDYGYSIRETADKGYIMSGLNRAAPQFQGTNADWTPGTNRSYDAWLIKLNPDAFLLSTENHTVTTLALFPNPAKEVLNVQLSDNTVITKITVTDILGKKVMATSNTSLDIQHLTKGVYTIQVVTEDNTYTSKFIKE